MREGPFSNRVDSRVIKWPRPVAMRHLFIYSALQGKEGLFWFLLLITVVRDLSVCLPATRGAAKFPVTCQTGCASLPSPPALCPPSQPQGFLNAQAQEGGAGACGLPRLEASVP